MAEAANDLQQEYWRPPAPSPRPVEVSSTNQMRPSACPDCGTEFVMGAQYCHACGFERVVKTGSHLDWLRMSGLRKTLGLSVGSMIAFFAGLACVIAAVGTGLIYSASTLVDWQAVQVWRLEWLLAAAVAFIGGVLLKKSS